MTFPPSVSPAGEGVSNLLAGNLLQVGSGLEAFTLPTGPSIPLWSAAGGLGSYAHNLDEE